MSDPPCSDLHHYMATHDAKFRAIIILPTLQDLIRILTKHWPSEPEPETSNDRQEEEQRATRIPQAAE